MGASGDGKAVSDEDSPKDCLPIVHQPNAKKYQSPTYKNSGFLQVMMFDVGGSSSQFEDEIQRLKEELEQLKISAAEAPEAKVEAEQEMGLAKQEAEAAKQDAEAATKVKAEADTERDS